MTSTQIHHATNVPLQVAPPSYYLPDSTGAVARAGTIGYELVTDSTGFSGQPVVAQFGIEIQINSVWSQWASGGQGIGQSNWNDSPTPTFVCTSDFTLSNTIPPHARVRIRMDSSPSTTLASVTLNAFS